jgi:hypothetical protein
MKKTLPTEILRKYVLLFFLCATHQNSIAQDFDGSWVGNYEKSFFMTNPKKLVVEFFIFNDSMITGLSHLYYSGNKYEHYKINGKINKADSTVYFSEDSTIAVKLGFLSSNCLGNYKMKLRLTDSLMILEGKWKDNSKRGIFGCPSVKVWLHKKIKNESSPNKPIVDSFVTKADTSLNRLSDVQSLIEISKLEKDSIKLEVYDNGEIDDDSISLYIDDSVLSHKQRISTIPLKFFITLSKESPIRKLRLVAESLGSIPPCTALLIITTAKTRHEVRLSSNFSKNAMVEFFLKE